MTFQVALYVIKCLIRVWNIKYNSVHCAANLLAGLAQYYVSNHWSYLIHLSHDHFCMRNTLKANNQIVLWLLYVFLDVSTAVFFLSFFFFFLSFFLFYFAALQFLLPAEKKAVCSWQPEFFFPSLSSWLWFLVYLPCFLLFLAAFLLSPLFIWSPLLSKPPLFPAYDFGHDWCLSHIK